MAFPPARDPALQLIECEGWVTATATSYNELGAFMRDIERGKRKVSNDQ
jgi:hypothetical protein